MADSKQVPKVRFKGFGDDWLSTQYMKIADVYRGLTYKPSDVSASGVKVLRSSNISEDTFVQNQDDVYVNEAAVNIEASQENDILITSANGSTRLVGKHAIIKNLQHRTTHGGFMLLSRAKKPYFVNACMGSSWYRRFINTYVAGGNGAIGNLKKSDLEQQIIFVPNDLEQTKIGELFKNLDTLINQHQTRVAQLANVKKSMLDKMFPKAGADVPEVRFGLWREKWHGNLIKDFCKVGDIDHRMPPSVNFGIPYVMTGDFYGINSINFENAKLVSNEDYEQLTKKIKPEFGDLLMARYASIGMVRYVETRDRFLVSYSCAIIKPFELMDGKYLFYYMQSFELQKQIKLVINTGSQPNVGIDSIKNLKVLSPSKIEQTKIGQFFQNLDTLIAQNQKALDQLKNLKQALLHKMFV